MTQNYERPASVAPGHRISHNWMHRSPFDRKVVVLGVEVD